MAQTAFASMVPGDKAGAPVATAGDVNGDGFADAIIGAPFADPHGDKSGSSYVVFGRAPDSARQRVGSEAGQYISGGPFDDTLDGREGSDELEGRGGADDLFGRADADTAFYLHAPAGVTASLANPAINSGDAVGDSYTSIENLTGSRLNDTLIGNGKGNRLAGGLGGDLLTGGGGRDIFALTATSDSPSDSSRDRITDFEAGDAATSVDKIDALPSTPIPTTLAISAFNSSATQRFRVSKAS
jgi:trimeric autotransporter adhesin